MNVLTTIVQWMSGAYLLLINTEFLGVPLLYYSMAFIITNMAIAVFWKGAHG